MESDFDLIGEIRAIETIATGRGIRILDHAMIRVIDEENEDYLYPASWFLPIELPTKVEQAILELVEH